MVDSGWVGLALFAWDRCTDAETTDLAGTEHTYRGIVWLDAQDEVLRNRAKADPHRVREHLTSNLALHRRTSIRLRKAEPLLPEGFVLRPDPGLDVAAEVHSWLRAEAPAVSVMDLLGALGRDRYRELHRGGRR